MQTREQRLQQSRRVSHPKLGYLGTIRRIDKQWVFHSAVRPGRIHEVIGSTTTGREAVQKLEELARQADERALRNSTTEEQA